MLMMVAPAGVTAPLLAVAPVKVTVPKSLCYILG